MPTFRKQGGQYIILNASQFNTGLDILDTGSTDVQKAFEDINNRLLIANETTDGLLSKEDKTKLNDFQYDVLSKYEIQSLSSISSVDVGQPIVRATVYIDGILLSDDEYSFTENDTIINFTNNVKENSVITVFFTNGLVANAVVDDTVTDTSHTYSSSKIEENLDDLGLTETVTVATDTITVSKNVRQVLDMYVIDKGELLNSNISSISNTDIILSDSTLDGLSVEITYNGK